MPTRIILEHLIGREPIYNQLYQHVCGACRTGGAHNAGSVAYDLGVQRSQHRHGHQFYGNVNNEGLNNMSLKKYRKNFSSINRTLRRPNLTVKYVSLIHSVRRVGLSQELS